MLSLIKLWPTLQSYVNQAYQNLKVDISGNVPDAGEGKGILLDAREGALEGRLSKVVIVILYLLLNVFVLNVFLPNVFIPNVAIPIIYVPNDKATCCLSDPACNKGPIL